MRGPSVLLLLLLAACGGSEGRESPSKSGAGAAGAGAGGSAGSSGSGGAGRSTAGSDNGGSATGGRTDGGTTGGQTEGGGAGTSDAGDDAGTAGAESSGGGSGGSAETSGDARDFCPRFVDEYCGHVARCDCGDGSERACRDYYAEVCDDPEGYFMPFVNAVEAGALQYHPQALDAAFEGLGQGERCNGFFLDAGYDSAAAYGFRGVFTGTKERGEECLLPVAHQGGVSDCREGLLCRRHEGAEGAWCVELAGEAQACDTTSDPSRICFEVRPPDVDNEFGSSFAALGCVPDGPGLDTGTCRKNLPNGSPCRSDGMCESMRCATPDDAGICAERLPDGEPCGSASDCLSGACRDTDTDTPTCSGPLANGEYCGFSDASCASGKCHSPGAGSGTSGGVCGDYVELPAGAACTDNFQCADSAPRCSGGACRGRVCQGFSPE
ncbi:MAG TPA: hypothetical protein VGK73_29345 [Polyangiaceae bacterium]